MARGDGARRCVGVSDGRHERFMGRKWWEGEDNGLKAWV